MRCNIGYLIRLFTLNEFCLILSLILILIHNLWCSVFGFPIQNIAIGFPLALRCSLISYGAPTSQTAHLILNIIHRKPIGSLVFIRSKQHVLATVARTCCMFYKRLGIPERVAPQHLSVDDSI